MNEFTFENNGINTYLVHEFTEGENVDSMGLGMITNNKIPGLAQTIFTQKDSSKFIKYNVSSKIALQSFFSGPVNKKRLLGVFKGIVDAFLSAEEYMLDNSSLILDVEYIFVDVSTCEVSMISLPLLGKTRDSSEICVFFRDIMYALQSDVTEDCSHVAKIINYLNATANFSLVEFKKELISLEGSHAKASISLVKPIAQIPAANQTPVAQQTVVAPAPAPAAPVAAAPAPAPAAPAKPQAAPAPAPAPAPVAKAPQVNVPPKAPNGMVVPPKAPNGMVVPPNVSANAAKNTANAAPAAPAATPDGKEMSLFYLLQHYNSDNAAAYKAQKEAKKAAKASGAPAAPQQAAPAKQPKQKKGKAAAAPAAPAMPVPGVPPMPAAPAVAPAAAPVAAPVAAPAAAPVQAPAAQPVPGFQPISNGANFGETTVLGGGAAGETTVLNAANPAAVQQTVGPCLIRQKNYEEVKITKYPFRIGKEKSFVDYFIGDNTAISRSHAEINLRDGEYFIKDTNSTNHTYINGTQIQSGVDVKLNVGDRLRFANEEFEFQMK